ncbi:MAG: sigma-54 dependent transcriptional regulator [Acidovorax sp.]|jgi:sigma-54-specific transcriptional regulator|nr:sigma-54 dependent transcriptional regulator [Acidovorax sp.]
MVASQVAQLAREWVQADSLEALAGGFVQAVGSHAGVAQALCYWCEHAGDVLRPMAHAGFSDADPAPLIPLSELDNPLVYCLTQAKPCLVDTPSNLLGVGAGFDLLRERFAVSASLLAMPLYGQPGQMAGVLVLTGQSAALRSWRTDPVWKELQALFQALLQRLQQRWGMHLLSHSEQRRVAEKGRARAARLLAAGFVGVGPSAKRLREEMLRLADSSLSLLLTGETGSGKDHAAWLIHQVSSREGKFVPVNCAAIPKDLIEAELFGAVRGAYTGATQSRTGLVADADGGTLFLDEIGDMPLELQGRLLRLLNEKKFRPVGATREQASDFRLICATHRPLPELVRDGAFREDLYFRIRQHVLRLPPLRERPEDIPALAAHVLLQYNRESQGNVCGLSAASLAGLQAHGFPGNVRELRSLILTAAERTPPGKAICGDLLAHLEHTTSAALDPPGAGIAAALEQLLHTDNLREAMSSFERLMLSERLRQAEGSRREAALSLGIPKRTLARKCQDLNLIVESPTP